MADKSNDVKKDDQTGKDTAEKEYTVCDKDNENFEIDTYTTKEAAEQRIQTLAAQGARPDRYEVKEGTKGDHEKWKKEQATKAGKEDKTGKEDKAKAEKGHEATQPKRY